MEKSKLLEHLRITIEQDPSFFATAKAENLNNIIEVNELLDKIKQEAKSKAESEIADLEIVFNRTPKILAKVQQAFEKLRESSVLKANFKIEDAERKHKRAEKLLEDAVIKVASGEYEAIIKAKSVAKEAKTTLIESHILLNSAIGIATDEEKNTIEAEERRTKEAERLAEEIEEKRKKKEIEERQAEAARARQERAAKNALTYRRIKKLPSIIIFSLIVGWIVGIIGGALIVFIIHVLVFQNPDDAVAAKLYDRFAPIGGIILIIYLFISGIKDVK